MRTDFSLASGLRYEVTAEGGSGYIRERVLRSLLEEEKKLIARGRTAGAAISKDNYAFTAEGINEERLAAVGIRPLRKERSLILGRMFLTMDGVLRRVEGRLAKNPFFWVTRVKRRSHVPAFQRRAHARVARHDGAIAITWIVYTADDVSLLANR